MPRYVYSCKECSGHFQVWHGMKEKQESCELCLESGHLIKVPQMPTIKREQIDNKNVGDITNNSIEENQQLLEEMKKEARNQTYDD
jgi:hypothetical protein